MTSSQRNFLIRATETARKGGHIFPEMAACEAALESDYGTSELAVADSNLFGMKQHKHPVFGTHNLPTREVIKGQWVQVEASFVHYPGWNSCFFDRMATLQRLASAYPHYAAALAAKDPETYVKEVSQTWSTDPQRAQHVIDLYRQFVTPATS